MISKAELRKQWEERVAEYRSSGLSVTEWCKERDLKPHQLRVWLRKFKPAENAVGLVPSKWMALEIGSPGSHDSANCLLVKVGHAVIEVRSGFNPSLLSEVVRSLSAVC